LILWIIIPEAVTTADKLQMRGENVTVSNIEKKVNEELETVKNKWNDLNANSSGAKKVGNAVHRFVSLIGNLIVMFLKFFAKIIGFAFLLAGVIGLISVISVPLGLPTMISLGSDGVMSAVAVQDIMHNLVGGTAMLTWIMITGILVWGIPMIALAFLGIKLLFNFQSKNKGIAVSFLGLWLVGVFMSFAISMIVMTDFSSGGTKTETTELQLSNDPDQVIQLALNHELGEDEPSFEADIFNLNLLSSGSSTELYGKPELDIEMAKTGGPKLVIKRMARAQKKQDAVERASKIDYGFIVNDTALLLNGYFGIPDTELWRTQEVELELLLPVGYTVYLNDDLDRIIYDIDNVTNTRDGKMLGRRWIMTPKGLACVDCDGITDKEPEDIDDLLEHELEKKQERLELEQERLEREMEKHQEELERIEEELEREVEPSDAFEEASFDSEEILLKRVINASYKLNSTTFRNTTVSYPG
jgi:chaperonin cofactor prefoldin